MITKLTYRGQEITLEIHLKLRFLGSNKRVSSLAIKWHKSVLMLELKSYQYQRQSSMYWYLCMTCSTNIIDCF